MGNHPNRQKVKDWARYLKEYRARLNLTQASLADRLAVSKRLIENWEAGENTPPAYLKNALRDIEKVIFSSVK